MRDELIALLCYKNKRARGRDNAKKHSKLCPGCKLQERDMSAQKCILHEKSTSLQVSVRSVPGLWRRRSLHYLSSVDRRLVELDVEFEADDDALERRRRRERPETIGLHQPPGFSTNPWCSLPQSTHLQMHYLTF